MIFGTADLQRRTIVLLQSRGKIGVQLSANFRRQDRNAILRTENHMYQDARQRLGHRAATFPGLIGPNTWAMYRGPSGRLRGSYPNPGRWPGLRDHGPLGRRDTNVHAIRGRSGVRGYDVKGRIAALQAASADRLPNPGRWPGLKDHGPLGRRDTNVHAIRGRRRWLWMFRSTTPRVAACSKSGLPGDTDSDTSPPLSSMPTTRDNLTVTPGQRSVIPKPRPTAWVTRTLTTGAPTGRDNRPQQHAPPPQSAGCGSPRNPAMIVRCH
jgi:hypothetical protein